MFVDVQQGRLTKSTTDSVGWDVYSTEEVLIPPQDKVVVGTGVVTDMHGCFGLIFDRSGLAAKFGVSRRAGVIDPDYNEEWKVVLVNEGKEAYKVNKGDRIAQVIFLPLPAVRVAGNGVEFSTEVRKGGLGSTGV